LVAASNTYRARTKDVNRVASLIVTLHCLSSSFILGQQITIKPTSLFNHMLTSNYEQDATHKESNVFALEGSDDIIRFTQGKEPVVVRFFFGEKADPLKSEIQELATKYDGKIEFASVNLEKNPDIGRDIANILLSFATQIQASGMQNSPALPLLVYTAQYLSSFEGAKKALFLYIKDKSFIVPHAMHVDSIAQLESDIEKKLLTRSPLKEKAPQAPASETPNMWTRFKSWIAK
jgi:hypothetical protein